MSVGPDVPLCGAKKRQGEGNCKLGAGHGTDHLGAGKCKFHGGRTTTHRVAAAKASAAELLAAIDLEPVEPHEALRRMVDLGSAQVDALAQMLRELVDTADQRKPDSLDLRVHLHELQKSMDRLVAYSKVALDAKVEERVTAAIERDGEMLAALVGAVLDGFGLRDDPRAPEVVRQAFRVIEGGRAAA